MKAIADRLYDCIDELYGCDLTYEDLRIIYGTYGEDKSIYEECEGKRRLVKFDYRKGFLTPLGDIKCEVWYNLAESLINMNFEGWITDSLQEWFQVHHPAYKGKDEQAARAYALKSHIYRDFDRKGWLYYLPWNRKYRSGVLSGKVFPTVVASCCNIEGETTEALICIEHREVYGYCPNCYKRSKLVPASFKK